MQELIKRAQEADLHVLIGCIDATNQAVLVCMKKWALFMQVLLSKSVLSLGNG